MLRLWGGKGIGSSDCSAMGRDHVDDSVAVLDKSGAEHKREKGDRGIYGHGAAAQRCVSV